MDTHMFILHVKLMYAMEVCYLQYIMLKPYSEVKLWTKKNNSSQIIEEFCLIKKITNIIPNHCVSNWCTL